MKGAGILLALMVTPVALSLSACGDDASTASDTATTSAESSTPSTQAAVPTCDSLLGRTVTGDETSCRHSDGVVYDAESIDCDDGGSLVQMGFIHGLVGERFGPFEGEGGDMMELLACVGDF